jgi:hypothetical protein
MLLEKFQDACMEVIKAANDPKQVTQVNWAGNYAKYGLLIKDEQEAKVQAMYILNNITHWRGDTAKEVRATMKKIMKEIK